MMPTESNIANKWNPNCGFVRADEKQAQRTKNLNSAMVALGKRCFIASNTLRNGSTVEAAEKFDRYIESLDRYLNLVENTLDQAAFFNFTVTEPRRAHFASLKFRLRNFLKSDGKAATRHPELFAKALCRIDHLVVDLHVMVREDAALRGSLN